MAAPNVLCSAKTRCHFAAYRTNLVQMMFRLTLVNTTEHVESARRLFREYAGSLGVDLAFQDFESELRDLPGEYAPPRGRLFLAFEEESEAGCGALRPLDVEICEMKRLYVRREFQGRGLGQQLAETLIQEARGIGYRAMRLDTLPMMLQAQELYRKLGFVEIAAYRYNPVPGSRFLELDLTV